MLNTDTPPIQERTELPRSKRAGKVNVNTDTDNGDTDTMTTATASDETTAVDTEDEDDTVSFPLESRPAPEDYAPNRKTPGRVRRPSYFDTILRDPSVYEQGYQQVPVTSKEHKEYVVRELNRAKLFLNDPKNKGEDEPEIGIALDLDDENYVYYRSRLAQKRERKAKVDENGQAVDTDSDDLEDDDSDSDN